jgi:hypothetical protein
VRRRDKVVASDRPTVKFINPVKSRMKNAEPLNVCGQKFTGCKRQNGAKTGCGPGFVRSSDLEGEGEGAREREREGGSEGKRQREREREGETRQRERDRE